MAITVPIRPRLRVLAAFAVLGAVAPPAALPAAPSSALPAPEADEGFTGEWEVTMDFGGRTTFATLEIAREGEAYRGRWGSADIEKVRVDGKKITFERVLSFGDQEITLECTATREGEGLTGTISSERGDLPFKASRPKPISPAVGTWSFHYAVGDREIDATLVVTAKEGGGLEGKWTSAQGEHVISDLKLDGTALTFQRKSTFTDFTLESTYSGKLEGPTITGKFTSDRGEIEAPARRRGGDLVGSWLLTTTTDQGTRTSLLKVRGDLSARYELFGGEVPIREVKVEGGDVSFTIETGFGDQTFTLEFKGKLEGGALKGQLTSPRGTRDVTGKRIDAPEKKGPKASL